MNVSQLTFKLAAQLYGLVTLAEALPKSNPLREALINSVIDCADTLVKICNRIK